MGNSANRPLLEAMTRESGGTAIAISNNDDIVGAVLAATSKVTHEAMYGVRLEIDGLRVADLTPARPASLYRGEQLVLFGHYWGDGPADVTLTARISGQPVTYRTRFYFPSVAAANPEIERLWAYAAIEEYSATIWMRARIASFTDVPDLSDRCLTLMFPDIRVISRLFCKFDPAYP